MLEHRSLNDECVNCCRHWTRREEADFYRIVSTFGVERDCENGMFIWDKFRLLARLERKLDNTLTEYFRAFYHMCLKVCHRFATEEDGKYLLCLFSCSRHANEVAGNGICTLRRAAGISLLVFYLWDGMLAW